MDCVDYKDGKCVEICIIINENKCCLECGRARECLKGDDSYPCPALTENHGG
jgi:hypothetical protein